MLLHSASGGSPTGRSRVTRQLLVMALSRHERRFAALFAIILVGFAVSACGSGFRPMHASAAFSEGARTLKAVKFQNIPGRVGQRIRNELIFQAHGGSDVRPEPRYRLDVAIKQRTGASLVASNGDSLARIYSLDATFQLVRLSDSKIVLKGTSYGRAPLQRYDQVYANVRAARDAENRAARTVATDLSARLQAHLAAQS